MKHSLVASLAFRRVTGVQVFALLLENTLASCPLDPHPHNTESPSWKGQEYFI
jgi:hypothetical protein